MKFNKLIVVLAVLALAPAWVNATPMELDTPLINVISSVSNEYIVTEKMSMDSVQIVTNYDTVGFNLYSVTADYVSSVPEPVTLSLLGLGLLALGSFRRKKHKM